MSNGIDQFSPDPTKYINPFLSGTTWDPTWTGEYDIFDEELYDPTKLDDFWNEYGMYFDPYDYEKEARLGDALKNKVDTILIDAHDQKRKLDKGAASLGLVTGEAEGAASNYLGSVGTNITQENMQTDAKVRDMKEAWDSYIYDTWEHLHQMGVLEAGEVEEHPGYDSQGNLNYDCQEGEGWSTGEGSFSENACEWMNEMLNTNLDWWFGEESVVGSALNVVGGIAEDLFTEGFGGVMEAGGEILGTIAEGVGGVISDAGSAIHETLDWIFSDERMKKNVELVGRSPSGVNIYEFSYKNPSFGEGRFRGVIAQEVPWASSMDKEKGFLKTDYSRLDVEYERVD